MIRRKIFLLTLTLILGLAYVLTACGDTSTNSTPTNGETLAIPGVTGAQEADIPASIKSQIAKGLPSNVGSVTVKFYVSQDDIDRLIDNTNSGFSKAGFKLEFPKGQEKLTRQGAGASGLFTKAGTPDMLVVANSIPSDPKDLTKGLDKGASEADIQKFTEQVKGKKAALFVFVSPELLKSLTETPAATNTAPTTAVSTTIASTTAPVLSPTAKATTAVATQTTAPASPSPATTPAILNPTASSGPGVELVGQLIAAGDNDLRVKSVVRAEQLKNSKGKTATAKGVFLVITFELANLGKKPSSFSFIKLVDGKGREFSTSSDSELITILSTAPEFRSSYVINPGFSGITVKAYDVPKDAEGFKIVPDKYLDKTERNPSASSFDTVGGNGSDSNSGQELSNKSLTTKDNLTASVTKVDRLTEIKANGKTFKTPGVYLIVQFDLKNDSQKSTSFVNFYLKDNQGRIFAPTGDLDLLYALGATNKYKSDLSINPGQSGKGFMVFEVTKEGTGFELVESF